MQVSSLEPSRTADVAVLLRDRIEQALRLEGHAVHRLTAAATSVTLRVDGSDAPPVTLLLDRDAPVLSDDPNAEITIVLPPDVAAAYARGEVVLSTTLLVGGASYTGEVRKFLAVDPVLRGLLARVESPDVPLSLRSRSRALRPTLGPAADATGDLLAVQTVGLRKSFGPNHILRGADIQIPEGLISTVLGPSGTGKSVLIKHVLGLLTPDAGEVFVHGRSLASMSRTQVLALRREIGVMFQDGALFSSMDVYDNVAFPLRQHTDFNEDEVRETVEDHLQGVGLLDAAHRFPRELSGGMRKRAGLARALALDPGIVLCDEPDSGLDPVRTALLGELLLARQADIGGTMIVVTHNIALARLISDHISVLWRGEVLASGPADEIWSSDDPFIHQFLRGEALGPLGMDA